VTLFDTTLSTLDRLQPLELIGTVAEVRGLSVLVDDLPLPVGGIVEVVSGKERRVGEVVGFDDAQTIVMLMGFTHGIRRGDRVIGKQSAAVAPVGADMLGRVLDALGRPVDGKGPIRETFGRPVQPDPIDAMRRVPIDAPLGTGVKALDTMLTVGRGQRLGIFAGPGVGKSTLLGQIARNTDADVAVIALVGERGREVADFLNRCLGENGLQRSVVIVATGDEPALMRIRAAMYALTVAEYFRDEGLDVVLFMDSVTRFCQAQRQVGLAVGEPPATKGYTPSVFAMLPTLMERCGKIDVGSITGFFTILVEGDDMTEPVSDASRGILDGHVVLSRELANRGHWPAIDVLQSVSRLANDVVDAEHRRAREQVTRMVSLYRDVEDLVNIGAYSAGANPDNDLAIEMQDSIKSLLTQGEGQSFTFTQSHKSLLAVDAMMKQKTDELARRSRQSGSGTAAAR